MCVDAYSKRARYRVLCYSRANDVRKSLLFTGGDRRRGFCVEVFDLFFFRGFWGIRGVGVGGGGGGDVVPEMLLRCSDEE